MLVMHTGSTGPALMSMCGVPEIISKILQSARNHELANWKYSKPIEMPTHTFKNKKNKNMPNSFAIFWPIRHRLGTIEEDELPGGGR